jgi:DNA-binding SARP family transcriptional activator
LKGVQTAATLDFRLLGPLAAAAGGRDCTPRQPKQRALLAFLLLHANEVVSTEELIEALWGERPPDTAANAVQGYVSALRKLLGTETIETRPPGYVLHVASEATDLGRFEQLVAAAHAEPEPAVRAELLREASALFHGQPLAEFRYEPFARDEAARIEGLQLGALEERVEADLALGRHAQLAGELEALVARHPLRERLRGQLMLALYRSGRQADALQLYREGRRVLDEELGLEPGPPLQELERRILRQDPALAPPDVPLGTPGATLEPQARPPVAAIERRWRRRPLLVGAVAGVVAAAAAIPLLALGRGDGQFDLSPTDSLIRIDAARSAAIAGVEVPGRPSAVTVCAGSVLVAGRDGTVSEIDPMTSTVYPIRLGGAPVGISHVGNLAAVVAGPPRGTVTLIDATFAGINWVRSLPGAPSAPPASASDGTSFWIANPNAHELEKLEPAYGRILARIPLPRLDGPRAAYAGVAAADGLVWVTGNDAEHTVWRVDPATRRVTAIRLPFAPGRVAAGAGGAWVVARHRDEVVRVDPHTSRLKTIRVGNGPRGIAVGAGSVWVANELDGTISRIDPERLMLDKTIHVGGGPIDVAVGLGAVWAVRQTDEGDG